MSRIIQIDAVEPEVRTPEKRKALALKERLPAPLVAFMEWAMRVSAWLFALAIFYDVYAVATGAIAQYPTLRPMEQMVMLRNLGYAGQVAVATGVYLAAYTFITGYDYLDRFVALLVIFAGITFGLPLLFIDGLGLIHSWPSYVIVHNLDYVADVCLFVTTLRLLIAVINFMRYGVGDTMKKLLAQKLEMPTSTTDRQTRPFYRPMGRCWELPYCREYLLKVCPAWQKKKTCWKHGSGCFCDSGMMDRLVQIEMGPMAGRPQMKAPSVRRGSKKCHTCSIYLEHEEQKFRVLSPIIPIAGLAGLVLGWDTISSTYEGVATGMGHIITQIALGHSEALANDWIKSVTDPVMEYTMIICGMLVLVSYSLKFLEWAILEKKL